MNAWTNLRLATIQADLDTRRAAVAAERLASTARSASARPAPSRPESRIEARLTGRPISTASRS